MRTTHMAWVLALALAGGCDGPGTAEVDSGARPDAARPEDGAAPTEDGGTPAEDGAAPTEDGGAPTEDGGTPAGDGGAPSSGFLAVFRIFQMRCAGCHVGPTAMSGGLAMGTTAESAYAALVGPDRTTAGACRGPTELVTPGDPGASFVMSKLEGPPPGCGARMPLGGALTPEEIGTVRAWIMAGAPGP